MQDASPLGFSISVVYFDSGEEELRALISSIGAAIERLHSTSTLAQTPLYLIDNSVDQHLVLGQFSEFTTLLDSQNIELRLVQGHGNIGYGRGHNLVVNKLGSEFHLFLNPDVELQPDALATGISYLRNNQQVVLASPYAEYAGGEKQFLCKRYPSLLTFFVRGFLPNSLKNLFAERLARFEMHDLSEDEPSDNIPIVSGCFMLCRSAALKSINGFDEGYFLYFEDFDLSLRIAKLGKLAYVPAMRIKHAGGHAARKGGAHIGMFVRSAMRFFNTHGWRFFHQTG